MRTSPGESANEEDGFVERFFLRPEARSVPWRQLDGEQRRAVKRMISLLNESVSDLTNAGERGASKTEFVLDGDRTSRIAFLSGERGTGKTTVLLSIKEAWNLARNLHSPGPPGGYLGEEDRESWNTLAGIANRLVWLDPLDMEPLPPSTNLLAAVLARIDRASEASGIAGGSFGRNTGTYVGGESA